MARAKLNTAQITDPAQRVLAGKVSEVCDIFFAGFASLSPEERLVDMGRAEDAAGKVRNTVRFLALGAVVHLGRELGIDMCDLHGQPTKETVPADRRQNCGSTQVPHLKGMHRNTCYNAQNSFVALIADKGDIGRLVEERFSLVLKAARDELAALQAAHAERAEKSAQRAIEAPPKRKVASKKKRGSRRRRAA